MPTVSVPAPEVGRGSLTLSLHPRVREIGWGADVGRARGARKHRKGRKGKRHNDNPALVFSVCAGGAGFSGGGAAGRPTGVQRRARDRAAERPVPGRRWSCGDSNPGPSHCEGVPDPIGHRSMRCMSCALTATVPRCRPRGAPGGHANRSLAGEPGHRRGSTFEPCVPLKAALRPRRAVSDRHVHDLRRRPTSRCHFVPLIQPVPTRPHRFRQISDRLLPHHPRG